MATPFPILTTKRLRLRKILPSDLNRVHFLRSDKEINRFIKRAETQTLETAAAHIRLIISDLKKNKSITWGITYHGSDVLLGTICLWNFSEDKKTAEVGYALDSKFQRLGIMSEALKAVLDYGFNLRGFETIEAYTDFRNIPSKKLLKQHGFIPSPNKKDTENQDNEVFYLNR